MGEGSRFVGRGSADRIALLALGIVLASLLFLFVIDPESGPSLLRAVMAKLVPVQPGLPADLPLMYAGVRG